MSAEEAVDGLELLNCAGGTYKDYREQYWTMVGPMMLFWAIDPDDQDSEDNGYYDQWEMRVSSFKDAKTGT
jgi:hypothetical protein